VCLLFKHTGSTESYTLAIHAAFPIACLSGCNPLATGTPKPWERTRGRVERKKSTKENKGVGGEGGGAEVGREGGKEGGKEGGGRGRDGGKTAGGKIRGKGKGGKSNLLSSLVSFACEAYKLNSKSYF